MQHTGLVLAYHGCDRDIGESILAGSSEVQISKNAWDWLGEGAYFWENSYHRALKWAEFLGKNPQYSKKPIRKPFVIGAIIDPGNCLDLTESESLEILQSAHRTMEALADFSDSPLPENLPASKNQADDDRVKRYLDCAVINFLHESRKGSGHAPFDTVRGAFFEGGRYTRARKLPVVPTSNGRCAIHDGMFLLTSALAGPDDELPQSRCLTSPERRDPCSVPSNKEQGTRPPPTPFLPSGRGRLAS
jgi:hypothetical protein